MTPTAEVRRQDDDVGYEQAGSAKKTKKTNR